MRPEYEASVKTTRINPVTKKREPFLTTWNKVVRVAVSASSVLFMVRQCCCKYACSKDNTKISTSVITL